MHSMARSTTRTLTGSAISGRTARMGLVSAMALLGATGCVEYTIETTVNPDGSGVRVEKMEVGENTEVDVSPSEFQDLMFVGNGEGWTHHRGVDDSGDSIQILERTTRISDLPSWSRLDGRVRISGAPSAKGTTSVGYVRLGSVQFRNTVEVGTGTLSDGGTSFRYRETFTWENAVDAIVESLMGDLDERLASRYPRLSDYERGEIVGFARSRLWLAVNDGLLSAEGAEEARLTTTAVDRTTEQALKIIRVGYPNESDEFVRTTLEKIYSGEGSSLETFLEDTVPGLNLALNTEIVFRLEMPGVVTESNADETEGGTLVWTFGPFDALAVPVEIRAQSILRR